MPPTPQGRTRGGRPRSERADEAIRTATLHLLAEHGYSGLTTDAIAREAGVSKATIYRRWSSKDEIVLAAVATLAAHVPVPDTGSIRNDLLAIAEGLVTVFSEPRTARLISGLVEQIAHKPALASAMREGFLRTRRTNARVAMERARDRGQVSPDVDLEFAVDLFAAPFYYRLLITGDPVDARLARQIVDATLAWIT